MAKSTRSKQASWKAKAMGALALAAVFGLPMGTAMADERTVDGSTTTWDSLFGNGVYNAANDKVTVNTNVAMSDDAQTLTVGNLILGGTATENGDLAFLDTKALTFTGGKIVADTVTLGGNQLLNLKDEADVILRIAKDASQELASISTKVLDYYSHMGLQIKNTTIQIADGGTFNFIPENFEDSDTQDAYITPNADGVIIGSSLMGYTGSPATSWNSDLEMTGGTLNMDASGQPGYGRLMELSSVDITGGTVNIGGYYGTEDKPSTSTLYGDMGNEDHFTIGGTAKVNLYDYGTIATFRGDGEANLDLALDITGGEINMLATDEKAASTIRAASRQGAYQDKATYLTSDSYGKLNITGGAINVAKNAFGAIMSRESHMTGGTINVDGGLTVAGGTNWDGGGGDVINYIDEVDYQWGEFTLDGGTINVNGTGRLVFYGVGGTGDDMVLNGGNGTLNGKLVIKDILARESADDPEIAAPGQAVAETVKVLAGKKFTVSELDLSRATAGSLTVDGHLVVNGKTSFGTDTAADSVVLNNGGILSAAFSDFLTNAYAAQTKVKAALDITETAQEMATIYLTGNPATYTQEQLDDALAALKDTNENLALGFLSGTMMEKDADGNDVAAVIEMDGTSGSGDTVAAPANSIAPNNDATAEFKADDVAITGSLTANTLTVTDSTSTTTEVAKVTVSNLTLVGDGSAAELVKDGHGGTTPDIVVADSGQLGLGVAGNTEKKQGGTVGDITLGTGTGTATLNVDDGVYVAKAITAKTDSAVDINLTKSVANAETSLTADSVNLATSKAVSVALNGAALSTANGGDVIVGGDTAVASTNHELTLANASSLTTGSGNIEFGKATGTNGSNILTVDTGSSLNAASITFAEANDGNTFKVLGDSNVTVSGAIEGDAAKDVVIQVGDNAGAGHIVAGLVKNAQIILDPEWGKESSTLVTNNGDDYDLGVLENSWFLLDNEKAEGEGGETWMKTHIPNNGKLDDAPGYYTAALGLRQQMIVDADREVVVNGALTESGFSFTTSTHAPKAAFTDKSLLLIDAAGIDPTGTGANAAIKADGGSGTATVAEGAALKIVNAKIDQVINVFDGFTTTVTPGGWALNDLTKIDDDTLLFDSKYLTGDVSNAGTDYTVTVKANATVINDLSNDYPMLSGGMVGMFKDFLTNGYDAGSTNPAVRAFSELFNMSISGTAAERVEVARTIEGAARIAAVAGVPTLASGLGAQVSSLVVDHNSMLNAVQPAFGSEPGQIGLWLTPFYRSSDVDGMDAGQFENAYELNYGGAAFGLDYNVSENFRLGLALNAGGGDSETQGGGNGFNKTENDFDFWGLSLYGSYTNGSFGLTADAGYTSLDNEITQDLPSFNDRLKASGGSDLFTLGLTGEYRVTTDGGFAVTPHAGLRYTSISTDDSLLKDQDSNRILDVSTDDQNLFQIPLGVKFGKDIVTDGGWTVTPSADLGVLFTMGDTDVDSKATISGTSYSGVTNTEVVDKAAFTGALGIQAKADNGLSLGLEYGLLASGNQTGHSVSGLLRFEF